MATQYERIESEGISALNEKQLKFLDEYMKDMNVRNAAKRIDIPAQPCRDLLEIPCVKAEVERRIKAAADATGVDVKAIVTRELLRMATFDMRKLFNVDGTLIKNPHDLSEEEARALVNFDIISVGGKGGFITRFNPGSKVKALELLGKSQGMFTDKVDLNNKVSVSFVTDFGMDDPVEEAEDDEAE